LDLHGVALKDYRRPEDPNAIVVQLEVPGVQEHRPSLSYGDCA
jgi:hypothetical protein